MEGPKKDQSVDGVTTKGPCRPNCKCVKNGGDGPKEEVDEALPNLNGLKLNGSMTKATAKTTLDIEDLF